MTRRAFTVIIPVVVASAAGCREPVSPSTELRVPPRGGQTGVAGTRSPAARCPEPPAPVVVPCDEPEFDPEATTGDDVLTLVRARFDELPGWADDRHAEAVPPFLASCEELAELPDRARVGSGPYGGRARNWRRACRRAARLPPGDDPAARAFFEAEFRPYTAHGSAGPDGKITGYYVQPLRASRTRTAEYPFPLFARPPDLVSVPLSDFIDDGRSRRIWGRVDTSTGRLVPYATRAEIHERGFDDGRVLLWIDDPADAFAVGIEGSGKATLPDGTEVWVAFAGKNGHRSRRLGSTLRAMRALRDARSEGPWSAAEVARYHRIAEVNESLVFFEIESRAGAIGTQDVILTPRRSLAVDRAVIPLSTPIWVDTEAPSTAADRPGPWRHLLVAQDTGGKIRGPVRADIYFGADSEAAAIGGRVRTGGRLWLLLPRAVRVRTTGPHDRAR